MKVEKFTKVKLGLVDWELYKGTYGTFKIVDLMSGVHIIVERDDHYEFGILMGKVNQILWEHERHFHK